MSRDRSTAAPPFAILHDEAAGRWIRFDAPARVVTATRLDEVLPALREVEQAVETHRWHAAGWLAYEAAPAFDPSLAVRPAGELPLLWFGLFRQAGPVDPPAAETALPGGWTPDIPPEAYARAFDQIKRHIREGDTYQVNFSHRLVHDAFAMDPWASFLALIQAQRTAFGAYVAAEPWHLCSASPELFFRLDGRRIESRPMKGTAPRGLWPAQDLEQAAALRASEKNRAENLMIVDMVRHDLGRIARPGSVQAGPLCRLEKHPTVWQMTSVVSAETEASVTDIFAAVFPPASITGAPKRRTMDIIAGLEASPRQVYTGTIGFLSPGRRAQFNVAIRTLLVDTARRRAEYGVGGGIVWDSACEAEQAECRTKARILATPPRPDFALLETMLWLPLEGIRLLELHLGRMRDSADYFGRPFDEEEIRRRIESVVAALPRAPHRLRLLLARDGAAALEAQPMPAVPAPPCRRVALARRPVDRADVFLYHKTTRRRLYEEAKADFPDHDDVILFNDAGEATESTIASLVVEQDGVLCTPPVECGLLPGTARAELLARGVLRERRIPVDLVQSGARLFLLNSVRGLMPAVLDISGPDS